MLIKIPLKFKRKRGMQCQKLSDLSVSKSTKFKKTIKDRMIRFTNTHLTSS